jgi:hypothetical protein
MLAFFKEDTDEELISRTVNDVFPHFQMTPGIVCILRMCTASLIYHWETVLSFNANVRKNDFNLQGWINNGTCDWHNNGHQNAWESNRHLTGVPAHVKELVDLQALRDKQAK